MSNPFGGKTTKTTETTNSNATVRPYAPDWVATPVQALTGRISTLGAADPQSYVAGADPLQAKAGALADSLTGLPWNFDAAADLTRGAATAGPASASSADYISKFLSPYLQDVVDATSADLDAAEGDARAQFDLGTDFQGSGDQIGKASLNDRLFRSRGTVLSGLRDQGYGRALTAADAEANRVQQARESALQRQMGGAQQLAQLSQAYGGEQRANIGALGAAGDALRGIATEQAQAPLTLASWESGAYPGLLEGFFGKDVTENSTSVGKSKTKDPMGDLSKAAATAALFAGSDWRIKTDIVKIGELANGLGVYAFRYLWSPVRHVGVMAQEVLRVKPWAVARHPSGFLMVNYAEIV